MGVHIVDIKKIREKTVVCGQYVAIAGGCMALATIKGVEAVKTGWKSYQSPTEKKAEFVKNLDSRLRNIVKADTAIMKKRVRTIRARNEGRKGLIVFKLSNVKKNAIAKFQGWKNQVFAIATGKSK
jgi:hypothetical protein